MRLLGSGCFHGNRIMADMSGTRWDATTQVSSKSVHWYASYGISNTFQHGGRLPSWMLTILIFDHVTLIRFLICCSIPNFIKIGSHVRPADAHTCYMFSAQLLGNRRLHGQPHHGWTRRDVMECDHPSFVQIGLLAGELWHFQYFPTWRLSAILNLNFVILDNSRSQLCGSTTLSKFGVDPIFAVEDIAILWLC